MATEGQSVVSPEPRRETAYQSDPAGTTVMSARRTAVERGASVDSVFLNDEKRPTRCEMWRCKNDPGTFNGAAGMTTANKITVTRILLIPVFVMMAIYYGRGVQHGHPQDWQRIVAIFVFLVA